MEDDTNKFEDVWSKARQTYEKQSLADVGDTVYILQLGPNSGRDHAPTIIRGPRGMIMIYNGKK